MPDVDAALKLYSESKSVLHDAGFNLRKFATDVPELQQSINDLEDLLPDCNDFSANLHEVTYAKATLRTTQVTQYTEQKVLGLRWDTSRDCLIFSVCEKASFAAGIAQPTNSCH